MNCNEIISTSKDKILLKIHVIPSSSKSFFPSGYNQWRKSIEVKVKSKAQENKANIEVTEIISKYFNIPTKKVSIISGQKSSEKIISISNLDFDTACNKLKVSLNGL